MVDTVGEAIVLASETRQMLSKVDRVIERLSDAATKKPAVYSELIGPTLRIKKKLETDLVELEALAQKLGL